MTFRLGLTGSIGMGKSTASAMLLAEAVPVWDADAAVHRLYAQGGSAVVPISQLHPPSLVRGAIDRAALKTWIAQDPTALTAIEAVVHPLVAEDRADFITKTASDIAVFDIPLLFENQMQGDFDATLLVTAPPATQRARVLARPGMTPQIFDLILDRQMPDRQKRGLATHIVETLSLDQTRAYIRALIAHIRGSNA
jgi:dephospho-CoA kinase